MEPIKTESEAAAVARLSATPSQSEIDGIPVLFVPDGYTHEILENLLPAPKRKKGTVNLHEVESFVTYVKSQGSLANCNIYLDVDYAKQKVQAVAIFNDHGDGDGPAGWRDHRAVYVPRFTDQWSKWNKFDGEKLPQAVFANFLEMNIGDVASQAGSKLPTGADMLTFVSQLQETRKVKYGSAINTTNGMVQLEFIEDTDAATKGKLEFFREFAIGVQPFMNGPAYELRAFLRYRIDRNEGSLFFWYELQRADRVLEDACKSIVDKIRNDAGVPVLFGTP